MTTAFHRLPDAELLAWSKPVAISARSTVPERECTCCAGAVTTRGVATALAGAPSPRQPASQSAGKINQVQRITRPHA